MMNAMMSTTKSNIQGVEILLRQNQDMENEIQRLNRQLDEATNGIHMRGYLYKYRDREISFASKWGLRYFVLQGQSLSYFADDEERRPRRTIDLTGCIIRDDGTKKSGQFYVFSIITHWSDEDYEESDEENESGNVLLRLSTSTKADSTQWMHLLGIACAENHPFANDMTEGVQNSFPEVAMFLEDNLNDEKVNNNSNNSMNNENSLTYQTIQRVKSSSEILQKSLSRVSLSNMNNDVKLITPRLLNASSSTSTTANNTNHNSHNIGGISNTKINELSHETSNSGTKSIPTTSTTSATTDGSAILNKNNTNTNLKNLKVSIPSSSSVVKKSENANSSHHSSSNNRNIRTNFPASKPIHVHSKPSPLSSDVRPSEQNYRGFFNLGVIILVISNIRLILDNLDQHGVVITFPQLDGRDSYILLTYFIKICFSYFLSIMICYWIELSRFRHYISEKFCVFLHVLFGGINIIGPILWVWCSQINPIFCMIYLFEAVIIWMKLISYAHVNYDLRSLTYYQKLADKLRNVNSNTNSKSTTPRAGTTPRGSITSASSNSNMKNSSSNMNNTISENNLHQKFNNSSYDNNAKPFYDNVKDLEPPFVHYPGNLTVSNLFYFCAAPTLCYQLNYPRSHSIRWRYVFSILVRFLILLFFMFIAIQQYIFPTLSKSVDVMKQKDFLKICEVILKLSIPNSYTWILMFYCFFHLWLNLLAELCRFGDRSFYKDWWNSRTISVYWKNWNSPVHNWMLRHLYYPLVSVGCKKWIATILVFTFSALFHEIIISIPFRCITFHAFFGMLAQAPLISITRMIDKRFDNAFLGNIIFWCLFCVIGQPMGIIMVYYDMWKFSSA